MHNHYLRVVTLIGAVLFLVVGWSNALSAQLQLERQHIGAVTTTSTSGSNGENNQLEVDASTGQTIIGYREGDIVMTIGFHQTDLTTSNVIPSEEEDVRRVSQPATIVDVTAYPNPTVDRVSIDLGKHQNRFTELNLVNVTGIVVATKRVEGRQVVIFDRLHNFPNANYFLRGIDQSGKVHHLATIMVVNH